MKILRNFYIAFLLCGIAATPLLYINGAHAQAFSGSCAAIRGSYTGTATGFTTTVTGTIQYRVTTNCQVTLWTTAALTGTSNAATMTLTGTPYNLAPASSAPSNQIIVEVVTDNSANAFGCVQVSNATPTVITFSNTAACAGAMTNTGTKAIPAGWTVTYSLY